MTLLVVDGSRVAVDARLELLVGFVGEGELSCVVCCECEGAGAKLS